MAAISKNITFSNLGKYWYLYFLVLPSLILVASFEYYPAGSAMFHAFFRWNGDYVNEFVGMQNFAEALRDPVLGYGFMLVGILIFANLIKMIPSMLTAVVINRLRSAKAAYVYKVLFVVPMIIPGMVYLLMWKFFYDPSVGIFNKILHVSGLFNVLCGVDKVFHWGIFVAGVNPVWLGDANLIIPSLILWGFPWVGIVGVLIYIAGLQSIEDSVYEAAAIDGIGPIRKFFSIELPLILGQVRINLVLMIIGTLQDYGLMLVLFGTGGGPQGRAMTPGLYMFSQAFENERAGFACAIGLIMFVLILILTEVNNRLVRIDK
jgi:ABC-type sugar transport system permease subunit